MPKGRRITSTTGTLVTLALLGVIGLFSLFVQYRFRTAERVTVPIEEFPKQLGGWSGKTASTLESSSREILQLDRYIRRLYTNPDVNGEVFVYVGYWTHQTGDHQAAKHTPKLCLPSNGWKVDPLGVQTLEVPLSQGTGQLQVNRIIGEIDHHRALIYYWFINGSDYYPEEWQSLARISWSAFLGRRTDGGIVEISIPIGPEGVEKAEQSLNDFVKLFLPRFDDLIKNRALPVAAPE